jgi:hypothetical protein
MEFFNKKEEVLEVKLTPYGRYKLSKGLLKPVYYSFFDEGVIYNSIFTGGDNSAATQVTVSEGQNNIEPRIQDDTPSLKALNVFVGIQTAQLASAAIIRQKLEETDLTGPDPSDPLFMDPGAIYNISELQYTQERIDFLSKPLGKSQLTSNKQPAWEVATHQGKVSSSVTHYNSSAGIEKIPQVNIAIKYRTYVAEVEGWDSATMPDTPEIQDQLLTETTNTHNVQAITTPIQESSGKYIVISPEDLIVEVAEHNADFNKENFDIEVYLSKSVDGNPIGTLTPLRFNNNSETTYTTEEVQYFLTINADNEIDSALLRQANITDLSALGSTAGAGVVSTRDYFIRNLYGVEDDICPPDDGGTS